MDFLLKACRLSKPTDSPEPSKMDIDGREITTGLQLHNLLTSDKEQFPLVQHFTLKGTPLKSIPQCIGSFFNIKHLDLSGNKIEYLPWSIVLLKKLEHLDVSNNCMAVVSPILCHFPVLKTLDLSNNALETLPTDLLNLTSLETLNVSGNDDIKSPPLAICQQGREPIFSALRVRKTRVDAFSSWKPYYQGNKTKASELNCLVKLCIDCIIESDIDFLSADIPPLVKTYLAETKKQESSLLPNLLKCSECQRYFSKTFIFENHDCQRKT